MVDQALIGRIFREESGRSVAALIRFCGDIDVAEDAVQDAFTLALRTWPDTGLPANPGGWITTTARTRAIDRFRREKRGRELQHATAMLTTPEEVNTVPDDRLRLIFTCCHPALSAQVRVALTLRLLGGLSTVEVAQAFLVSESTMAQRLVRAKHKITAARIPYRIPEPEDLPGRLRSVQAVLYLIYNTGNDLCGEAIRLARLLHQLMPDEPEVAGLLALMLLIESRRPSRIRPDGSLVVLAEQDRTQWDQALIQEGQDLLRWCLRRDHPGPYQLQAAINAVHADAATAQDTDWPQILTLYDHLYALTPTPVVALNRAIAVAEVHGPASALVLIDALDLDGYYAFHATRADLLHQLGRHSEASAAYQRAGALAPTEAERVFLSNGGRYPEPRERSTT
ncbi:RNA polymerase sigma factor [Actinocrispum sp. NPDC049592]|uniref:RNA polymerase sigma factor n=1 Tax=Actinocrispum sp. NPDC049592 TaxID=3154835 RepID=UPI00343B5413